MLQIRTHHPYPINFQILVTEYAPLFEITLPKLPKPSPLTHPNITITTTPPFQILTSSSSSPSPSFLQAPHFSPPQLINLTIIFTNCQDFQIPLPIQPPKLTPHLSPLPPTLNNPLDQIVPLKWLDPETLTYHPLPAPTFISEPLWITSPLPLPHPSPLLPSLTPSTEKHTFFFSHPWLL